MNEQIKQLWEQAAKTTQGDSWDEQTQFMERFAKLIVMECAERFAAEPDRPFYGRHVANQIRKHFGVEE